MNIMSSLQRGLLAMMLTFAFVLGNKNETIAQNQYVDFDVFYNELAPYGNWYDDPEYGYVWQPTTVQNFQPYYTNGYWVMTEYGNTWVSNYNWGWAPFHYGRWHMSRVGWVWIPGTQWGPAWVDWRHGNGYYGWAPMGPSLQINIGNWNTPVDWFVFVPQQNIYNRGFSQYYRPNNYMNIYSNTIVINNYYNDNRNRPIYNYGPRRDDIRRYTNRDVTVYNVTNSQVRNTRAAPRGNSLPMYRPEVNNTNRNAAPRNVRSINNAPATNTATPNRNNANTRPSSTTVNRSASNQVSTNNATTTNRRAAASTQSNVNNSRQNTPARVNNTPTATQQNNNSNRNVDRSATRSTTPTRSAESRAATSVQSAPSRSASSVNSASAARERSTTNTSREVSTGARR